jgi:hypothetical protein
MVGCDTLVARRAEIDRDVAARVGIATLTVPPSGPAR